MTGIAHTRVVVTDTCVIINLIHVERLTLLGALRDYEFVIPDHVYEEVIDEKQHRALDAAIDQGALKKESLTDLPSIELYADLRTKLGSGEAACLALADTRGWMISSDEGRLFRREVIRRLGEDRLLTTVRLYMLAIEVGVLTVEEADLDKAALEQRRFKMGIASFRDLAANRRPETASTTKEIEDE